MNSLLLIIYDNIKPSGNHFFKIDTYPVDAKCTKHPWKHWDLVKYFGLLLMVISLVYFKIF